MRTIVAISMPNFHIELAFRDDNKFILNTGASSVVVRTKSIYEALQTFHDMYYKLLRNYN